MNIIKRTVLMEKECQQMLAVTKSCHQLDGTYRTPSI